jgi:hypothetical protein
LRGSRELALESAAQGQALLTVLRTAWLAAALDALEGLCREADVEPPVMERDAGRMRGARPFVFTNLRADKGVAAVAEFITTMGGLAAPAA